MTPCFVFTAGVKHDLRPKLMAQPPWDKGLGEFFILHFTYGNDYDENGVFTPGKVGKWRFDKRSYMAGIPPKNLDPPPARVRQRTRQAADRDDERGERDAAELGGSARGGAGRGAADATRGVAGTRSGHRLHRPSTGADCNSIRR